MPAIGRIAPLSNGLPSRVTGHHNAVEDTGSPVNGDRSWGGDEGDGERVAGWVGAGVAAACLTRTPPLDTSSAPTTMLARTKATPDV